MQGGTMTYDFITLACPTCGGKLNFSSNTTSLICPSCGNEHLVRHDATNITLESYARCPVCGRNDEVKKVSAIVANQTQSMQGVTIEKSSYRDKDGNLQTSTAKVPFSGKQSSVLAMKLQPPAQTKIQKLSVGWYVACFFAIGFLIEGIIFIFLGIFNSGSYSDLLNSSPAAFIMGGLLMWWCIKKITIYKQSLKIYERELPNWQRAVERWKKLYYCFRDDCVFMPGEKTYVETDSINAYIYRGTSKISRS